MIDLRQRVTQVHVLTLQAVYTLLNESKRPGGPIFLPVTAALGSIAACPPGFGALSYGLSKVGLSYIAKRISEEHENIKVILVQ